MHSRTTFPADSGPVNPFPELTDEARPEVSAADPSSVNGYDPTMKEFPSQRLM